MSSSSSPVASVLVLFYSLYGHTYHLALEVAKGARSVPGVEVILMQVPETVPEEVLSKTGAKESKDEFQDIPVASVNHLKNVDAIIVGTPTRFGSMCHQMRAFWDMTGGLWTKRVLVGKVGSVFTTSSSQHGGQETTITSTWNTFAHHGMVIVPIGYASDELYEESQVMGGSPYGAASVTGKNGTRTISELELKVAFKQGQHVANVTKDLMVGRGINK